MCRGNPETLEAKIISFHSSLETADSPGVLESPKILKEAF